MTSVREHGCLRHKRSSATLSVALPNSSPPLESGDKMFDQPARPSGTKPSVTNAPAAINIPKYSEDNLQQIFKSVLEARALAFASTPVLAPASTLALIVAEAPREKLKARSSDVYRRKFHIDCYNFCQQYENYFATAGATGPTRILFATSFLWYRISFRWQYYK